jgi:hypothetical protein
MITLTYPGSVSYGPNTALPAPQNLRQRLIEHRAYEIWQAKGCPHDTAFQDWLQAEVEVDARLDLDRWSYVCKSRITPAVNMG